MSELTTAPSQPKSYDSGPFHVVESTTSIGGRDWLTLRMSVTQELMIPLESQLSYRKSQLEGERTLLGMLSDRVSEAIDNLMNADDDK